MDLQRTDSQGGFGGTTIPELYDGIRLEVKTPDNRLIFLAEAELEETEFGLRLILTERNGRDVPQADYGTLVKMTGVQQDGVPFALYGSVFGHTNQLWKVDKLQGVPFQESREYFRQSANLEATVMCVTSIFAPELRRGPHREAEIISCQVLDVSGGGVCIRCEKECGKFEQGDWLYFSTKNPVNEKERLDYTCRVQRVTEKKRCYEYGCQFQGLDETEREPLLYLVLTLQQEELRIRRGMKRTD